MTLPTTIRHAEQQVQEWLKELRDNGDLVDLDEALAVLRVVLHQLRDRLSVEEAVDLAQQLPIIVRGLYFEGWRPSRAPSKVHSRQQLFDVKGFHQIIVGTGLKTFAKIACESSSSRAASSAARARRSA